MTCEEIKPLLQQYVDNELDEQATLVIDNHIETCKICSDAVDIILADPQYQMTKTQENGLLAMARIASLTDEEIESVIERVHRKAKELDFE